MNSTDVFILEELLRNYDSRVGPFEYTGLIKCIAYLIFE